MRERKSKYDNFMKAIKSLNEGIQKFNIENDLLRDGLIQRFEFTFELCWKALKAYFEDEGLIGINSPKSVLREAFSTGLIDNDELWLNMLNDRNSTTHIYNESQAVDICNKIIKYYASALEKLAIQLNTLRSAKQ